MIPCFSSRESLCKPSFCDSFWGCGGSTSGPLCTALGSGECCDNWAALQDQADQRHVTRGLFWGKGKGGGCLPFEKKNKSVMYGFYFFFVVLIFFLLLLLLLLLLLGICVKGAGKKKQIGEGTVFSHIF